MLNTGCSAYSAVAKGRTHEMVNGVAQSMHRYRSQRKRFLAQNHFPRFTKIFTLHSPKCVPDAARSGADCRNA